MTVPSEVCNVTFVGEQSWLEQVRRAVENGGDRSFYVACSDEIKRRKDQWKHVDDRGDFSSEELVELIRLADDVLRYIDEESPRGG